LLLGAYALIAVLGIARAVSPAGVSQFVPTDSLLWWLMGFNLFLLGWRSIMKMGLVGRLYGIGHGLLSIRACS
jgi:hypothetical protein